MIFSQADIQIINAFLEISRNKSNFSDVSMSTIAKKVGISRQALYQSHFHNTDEIIRALYFYVDQDIYNRMLFVIKKNKNKKNIMELLIREATSLIYKNSYIFKILYSKHHDSSWVLFIEEHYSRILLPILEKRNNNQSTFIPVGMQAKFIIHNFIGLISIWMHQEKPELPEEYAEKIIYLFKTSAEQLIKLDNK